MPETDSNTSASQHTTRPEDVVPIGEKMALGAGGFPYQNGNLIVNYIAQPIFQIFMGLNPILFGLAMFIPRIWDAFTDPIMGRISDRHKSKYGRRRPFIMLGAILMAVTFSAIWFVPLSWKAAPSIMETASVVEALAGDEIAEATTGLEGEAAGAVPEETWWEKVKAEIANPDQRALFFWLSITSVLFFTAYTVYSVPCYALACEMTPDYHERTRVMFVWALFFNIGNLCINWYAPAAHWDFFENPLIGSRWVGIAIGISVFLALGSMPAFFAKDRFYKVAQREVEKKSIGFFTAIAQVTSSRHMLGLVGLVLALNFCATIAGGIALYIVIYYVKSGDVEAGIKLNAMNGTGFAIVGFLGIFVLRWLALKWGKRKAMFAVLFLTIFGGISKYFIFTPDMPYLLLLDSVMNGPIWVSLGVLIPGMVADLCDWDELQNGERREGVISAVFTWIGKTGTSLTFLVGGFALVISGFDESLGANQPEGTMDALRYVFVGASVAAPVFGMAFLSLYGISEKGAYQIRAELEARRGRV